jgi:hypothetical protein
MIAKNLQLEGKVKTREAFLLNNVNVSDKGRCIMITSKITRQEILDTVSQYELLGKVSELQLPSLTREGDYNSFKLEFDKLTGSRARCYTATLFKHSFSELAKSESEARGVKIDKETLKNLFERFAQIQTSFFSLHSKGDVRKTYYNEFLSYLRNSK